MNLVKIKETNILLIDGDRGVNYPQSSDLTSSGYCLFLSAENIDDRGFSLKSCQFISQEKDGLLRGGKLKRNDIVMMTRGSVGNVAIYDDIIPFGNVRINSGMIIFRCQNDYSPVVLYQLLKSDFVKKQISQIMSGSVQKQLPISAIREIRLMKEDENLIKSADILSSIDAQIKRNNEMVHKLQCFKPALNFSKNGGMRYAS